MFLALWFATVALYSMYPVYPRTAVLETMSHDLANHVRHAYEAGLALREGQVPPLVTPALDSGRRLPLFQYYSGTSYLLPAAASLVVPNPYRALKLGIFLHVLAAGAGMYGACRLLGARRAAALVAGTAYQLAPFVSADLYARGSYTEFAALTAAPVVLYWALRLARSRTRREALNRLCLCGLALAYFVPLHPVQTLLCGGLIGVAAATHALIDRRASWPALAKLAAAGVLAVTASAWFWVPVVRDYHDLRIVAHGALLDAGLADPAVLLWPGFREAEGYPWAPQLGFHFALAAVLVLIFRKDARSTGLVAATALLAIVSVVLFHERLPTVQRLLTSLQWTYRLLVPATLAGSVCLALALTAVLRRINDPAGRGLAIGVTIAYVVATSVPYFLGPRRWVHTARVRNVVSPEWLAPNSDPYALRGTDYARLGIVRADGTLNVNTDLAIRPDGVATDLRILLRTPAATPAAGGAPVTLTASVRNGPGDLRQQAVAEAQGPSHARVTFTIRPRVGHQPGDSVVRFNTPAAAAAWLVT